MVALRIPLSWWEELSALAQEFDQDVSTFLREATEDWLRRARKVHQSKTSSAKRRRLKFASASFAVFPACPHLPYSSYQRQRIRQYAPEGCEDRSCFSRAIDTPNNRFQLNWPASACPACRRLRCAWRPEGESQWRIPTPSSTHSWRPSWPSRICRSNRCTPTATWPRSSRSAFVPFRTGSPRGALPRGISQAGGSSSRRTWKISFGQVQRGSGDPPVPIPRWPSWLRSHSHQFGISGESPSLRTASSSGTDMPNSSRFICKVEV